MDASFHVRPFAFDRIFAVPTAASADPTIRMEDLHLQVCALDAELTRLRDDQDAMLALARADAFEAGLTQARSERETAMLSATDALQASIEMVDARFEEVVTRMQQDSAEVALSAADVLAARALQHAPGAAIDEAIGRVLRQVARGQELLVRVHPDHITEIERMVAIRQGGDRRRLNIQVVADESLPLGDANIEWDQGGLVLDASARAEAIRAELEALLPQA